MAKEWDEQPPPIEPPPRRPLDVPLQIGGVTRPPRRPPAIQPPPKPRPPNNIFTPPPTVQPPPSPVLPPPSQPTTPPGFVEQEDMPPDPLAPPNITRALPPMMPENWNAILQSLGFFSGPSGGAIDLPRRLMQKDPLARLQ